MKQYREGEIKTGDFLTGPLAISLAERCDCFSLVRTCNVQDDPNFPVGETLKEINNLYLEYLLYVINKYDIKLVIDLHGCNDTHNVDCSIWSDAFKTCDSNIISLFENEFIKRHLSCDKYGNEYFGGQVTRQVAKITNVFQLEVKRYIRSLKRDNRDNLYNFIEAMESSIHKANVLIKK